MGHMLGGIVNAGNGTRAERIFCESHIFYFTVAALLIRPFSMASICSETQAGPPDP